MYKLKFFSTNCADFEWKQRKLLALMLHTFGLENKIKNSQISTLTFAFHNIFIYFMD